MKEHTKEPWRVGRPGSVVANFPVPDMRGSDDTIYYGGHLVCESVTEANAHRIIACVNACAGIDTGMLECFSVLHEINESKYRREKAERDREEALAALELLLEGHENGIVHGFDATCDCQACKASAVIARLRAAP